MSVYSGERTDDLDDLDEAAKRFGAGGIGHGPTSPVHSGLMTTHSSIGTTRTSSGGDSLSASVTLGTAMTPVVPTSHREVEDTSRHPDAQASYSRQVLYSRAHTASPLNQTSNYSYSSDDLSLYDHGYCDTEEARQTPRVYNDGGDDDNDSDASSPIEVRRRRPSVLGTPPRGDDSEDGNE
jgi:hypothetical protein